jgi:HD-GYP domain-containing protein (c-di-GMP phosphodiesterase class II)
MVAPGRKMSMDSATMFACALLVPPALAAATMGVAIAVAEGSSFFRLKRWPHLLGEQIVFNASQSILAVLAAGWMLELVHGGVLDGFEILGVASAGAAALVMFAVNDVLLLGIMVAQVGRRIVPTWLTDRGDILYDAALYASGFVIALAGNVHPLLLGFLAFPVAVFHRAMRDRVTIRIQSREAIIAMADVIDARDHYTFEHSKRVAEYVEGICGKMDLSPDVVDDIVSAARVHDIGKIGIRDAVLLKPGKLTDEEFGEIRQHPDIGARLTSSFPDFRRGTAYIRHHHEKWDGSGYPAGLAGTNIPLGARIISVADTYDAITTTRVYRPGLGEDFARTEMARVAGQQLDVDVVAAFFRSKGWAWPVEESAAA